MLNIPIDFSIKAAEEDSLTIEGYANTTTVDRVGDIILEEAWTKGGLDNYLKNPIILAYHKHDKPIGKMVDYAVNNKGLKITADISSSTGEIYSLIKSGVLKTFSVGFRTKDADYDTETDLFVIKDLELMEISVVSIPANADSTFSVRKSFKTEEEYTIFKSEFDKDTGTVIAEEVSLDNSENNEEKIMTDKLKSEMEAEIRAEIEKEQREEAARKEAIRNEVSSQVKEVTSTTVEVVGERVEELKSEIETRLADESKSFKDTLEGLQNEIKEYADQLQALNNSKMQFLDKGNTKELFTDAEKDFAVMVSKMAKKPIEETKWFAGMLTKSDAAHQTGMTEDWEAGFALRLWDDIREKLIIENMFTNYPMNNVTVNLPLNPEAGYGTWVTTAQYAAATSSGTARVHGITDTSITAHKLATKELLSYEEEDDSMIAMVPLIREAAVRRMAKSSDKALLIGDTGVSAGAGEGNYPFDGLATIGIDDTRTVQIGGTLASPTAVTVANLSAMRRQMGVHGHSPDDVVYVVNQNVYFDLLDDADFRTMDMVGVNATILTGQIGRAAGSPVVVSGEFPAAAASNAAAIAVNMRNYLNGTYKGLTVERERSVENQTNLLVVTRRFGMIELFPANPTVVTLINPAT
jgi:HK97 family phage prohead protease/HK97 family phage major capsid protein